MTYPALKILPALMVMGVTVAVSACQTTPKAQEIIVLPPQQVQTCMPMSALQKVVIPAKTEVFYAITEIENPPYEPIQRKEKLTREVAPAEIIYVDSMGQQVIDICEQQPTYVGNQPLSTGN
ncbi:MAG: hypothetical protein ACPGVT_06110 [Maricaulaceae bacterium]